MEGGKDTIAEAVRSAPWVWPQAPLTARFPGVIMARPQADLFGPESLGGWQGDWGPPCYVSAFLKDIYNCRFTPVVRKNTESDTAV